MTTAFEGVKGTINKQANISLTVSLVLLPMDKPETDGTVGVDLALVDAGVEAPEPPLLSAAAASASKSLP